MNDKVLHHLGWISALAMGVLVTIQAAFAHPLGLWLVAALFYLDASVGCVACFAPRGHRIGSIVQLVISPFAMIVLLLATMFNLPEGYALYVKIGMGVHAAFALFQMVHYAIVSRKKEGYEDYARFLCGAVSALYAFVYATCVFLDFGTDVRTALILLLIKVGINIVATFAVVYYALGYLVIAFAEKKLTFKGRIRAIAYFFTRYDIGFYFSEFVSTILLIVSAVNVRKASEYRFLCLFYALIIVLRAITFVWSKHLNKLEGKIEPLRLSEKRNALLIVNSGLLIGSGGLLGAALLVFGLIRINGDIPWWFFVGVMFPFAIFNFVLAIIGKSAARRKDDASIEASASISLITGAYSSFAGMIYFFRFIPDERLASLLFLLLAIGLLIVQTVFLIIFMVQGVVGIQGKRPIQRLSLAGEAEETMERIVEEEADSGDK